jgi:hypothetical protein
MHIEIDGLFGLRNRFILTLVQTSNPLYCFSNVLFTFGHRGFVLKMRLSMLRKRVVYKLPLPVLNSQTM